MSNSKKQTQKVFPLIKGRKQFGFTLIELLVTMTIMGLLFVIAMPVFTEFQAASRLKEASQIVGTVFGEAFSSARSRPECFVVEGEKGNPAKIWLKSYARKDCQNLENEKTTREQELGSGIKMSQDFQVKFSPPFGDIEFLDNDSQDKDDLKIKLCNTECVGFQIYKKSGLVTKSREKNNNDSTIDFLSTKK